MDFLFESKWKMKLEDELTGKYQENDESVEGEHTWFCFLPNTVKKYWIMRDSVLPKKKSRVIYTLPSPSIVTNPFLVKNYFDEIMENVREKILNKNYDGVSVLGVSLTNALAIRLANEEGSCKKLLSVVSGGDLPDCIVESTATRHVYLASLKRKQSYRSFRDALDEYSPINNLDNLPADIEIHTSFLDRMVPKGEGQRLINEIKEKGYNPKIVTRYLFGHLGTIALVRNNG